MTGLDHGQLYYFTATAFNAEGQESGYSNEIGWETESVASAAGMDTITATGGGGGGGCFITGAVAE